jgi:hypothetical protein
VDFPIERDPAEAWPDFIGWRLNYEDAAYAEAKAINAVPALWSGLAARHQAPLARSVPRHKHDRRRASPGPTSSRFRGRYVSS